MDAKQVKQIIGNEKVVPILRTNGTDKLLNIAKAVYDSGIRILEFTMTIPGIIDYIPKIKSVFPDMLLGMGTVVKSEDAKNAIANGIDFIVSHFMNLSIVDTVKSEDKMLMLAAFTPTEIHHAHNAGSDIVKLFPALALAPDFIKSVRGPMPDVDILPTGGLDLIAVLHFLQRGAFAAGIGSEVFRKDWIKAGDYQHITRSLTNIRHRIKNKQI